MGKFNITHALIGLHIDAGKVGMKVETYDPGDGVKIALFRADDPSDFFGPGTPIFKFHASTNRQTVEQALAFIDGWRECVTSFGEVGQR